MAGNSRAKLSLQNIKGLRDRAVMWDTEVKGFGAVVSVMAAVWVSSSRSAPTGGKG
jgi:hypothetical protein